MNIPSLKSETTKDIREWFDEMLNIGLYIHPEDDPADYVNITTGIPLLNPTEARKVDGIYDKMFQALRESQVYDIATAAWYEHKSYAWDANSNEWKPKS